MDSQRRFVDAINAAFQTVATRMFSRFGSRWQEW